MTKDVDTQSLLQTPEMKVQLIRARLEQRYIPLAGQNDAGLHAMALKDLRTLLDIAEKCLDTD